MRKIISAGIAVGTILSALSVATPAVARQGCGAGYHRTPNGYCRPNAPTVRTTLVIGRHYPGRGYWDGHRYWRERYRHHHGWRYR